MLIITGIKFIEVPGIEHTMDNCKEVMRSPSASLDEKEASRVMHRHLVRGRHITTEGGLGIILGMTPEVENTIGLAYDVHEKQVKTIANLDASLSDEIRKSRKAEALVEAYRGMDWKQRIAFLFRGNKHQ